MIESVIDAVDNLWSTGTPGSRSASQVPGGLEDLLNFGINQTRQRLGGLGTDLGLFKFPALTVQETDTHLIVHADIPGVQRQALTLDVKPEGWLTFSAERSGPADLARHRLDGGAGSAAGYDGHPDDAGSSEKPGKRGLLASLTPGSSSSDAHATTLYNERFFGQFKRQFKLPARINTATSQATLRDGVLELRLQKADQESSHRLTISD